MSSQPSWRPNLPESQLFGEKTFLQGAILAAVSYGVTLALFVLIISPLIKRLKVDIKDNGRAASRQTICLLTYVCVTFILSTLAVASQAEMTQLSFIENRDIPGGPATYEKAMFSIPISTLGNCCVTIMNWLSDSLLLWRCSVIYRSSRASIWLVIAIPGLMLLASFVTGIISLERISRPSSSPWVNSAFSLVYGAVTIGLNIVLTLMIVIRLYLHRRRLKKLLGRRHAAYCTSIISMLIESSAIPFVVALLFLISFAMGSQLANIPLSCIFQFQAVATYIIIFRVVNGTAWTSHIADSDCTIPGVPKRGGLSNIRFQSASAEHTVDSTVISLSRNQDSLDGRRYSLDIETNSRSTVSGDSARDPGVIEKAEPQTN